MVEGSIQGSWRQGNVWQGAAVGIQTQTFRRHEGHDMSPPLLPPMHTHTHIRPSMLGALSVSLVDGKCRRWRTHT